MGILGSDVYASISLSVLIEIPSYAICFFVFDKFGRRPTLVWSQFLVWYVNFNDFPQKDVIFFFKKRFPCLLAVVAPYASLHHDWSNSKSFLAIKCPKNCIKCV